MAERGPTLGPSLDAVRALHQTVVALRAALEQSKEEIAQLKRKKVVKSKFEAKVVIKGKNQSLESLLAVTTTNKRHFSAKKSTSLANLAPDMDKKATVSEQITKLDDIDQDQEVDDIELIFTTDDTKEFKEQLVSIDDAHLGNRLLQCPQLSSGDLDLSDRELDDDVFNSDATPDVDFYRENSMYNSKSDNSINQENKSVKSCYSYQDSSFENKSLEKDESFDRFEERIRIVETDISKCGIQEVEYGGLRRNTCPNPLQYRPLIHREALSKGIGPSKKSRPILAHSNAIRKESGAQTDISALPGAQPWLSESNLAHKESRADFATLPSKFPMPGSRLRLSEKTTVEARRVLLSDIGFTSMVPELSRSADHLFQTNNINNNRVVQNQPISYGQFLKAGDIHSPGFTSQKFSWVTTTASPTDASYSNSLQPLTSPNNISSRRCSAPVSPSRRYHTSKPHPAKVRFANGSLPELRPIGLEWGSTFDSGGDSTDSLVEEAENYLRRSIDCILTRDRCCGGKGLRRASAPDGSGDNVAPIGWQPFLARTPRDLKLDHWVKVITAEGRVRGGRVRYIGPVVGQSGETFVGVQLGTPDGHSDGTFSSRRYFQCEPYHGIFVPFKKVIMGWRP